MKTPSKEQQLKILNYFGNFEKIRKKANLKYSLVTKGSEFLTGFGFLMMNVMIITTITILQPSFYVVGVYNATSRLIEGTLIFFLVASFLVTGFALFARLYYPERIKKEFKNKLKSRYTKLILKDFDNIKWFQNTSTGAIQQSNVGLNNEFLSKSALFANYNERIIDDEFRGSHGNVNFEISETHMRYVSSGGKNRCVADIFKGVIVAFNSNKKVLNRTIVTTKGDVMTKKHSVWIIMLVPMVAFLELLLRSFEDGFNIWTATMYFAFVLITGIVIWISNFRKKEEPLNKVVLEDSKFNKKFNVYSSDQVEARYLVTPSFMERLNNLTTAFGTNKVKCSFFDDKFMIAISTNKDLFEIGRIDKPLTNVGTLETFYKELNSIYDMIDYFKLDEKTGL